MYHSRPELDRAGVKQPRMTATVPGHCRDYRDIMGENPGLQVLSTFCLKIQLILISMTGTYVCKRRDDTRGFVVYQLSAFIPTVHFNHNINTS